MNITDLPTFDEVPANGIELRKAAVSRRMSRGALQALAKREHSILGFYRRPDGEMEVVVARELAGGKPVTQA